MVGIVGVLVVVLLAVVAVVVLTQDDDGAGGGGGDEREAATAAVERFVEAVNAGTPGAGGTVQPAAEVDAAFADFAGAPEVLSPGILCPAMSDAHPAYRRPQASARSVILTSAMRFFDGQSVERILPPPTESAT